MERNRRILSDILEHEFGYKLIAEQVRKEKNTEILNGYVKLVNIKAMAKLNYGLYLTMKF